MPFPRPTLSDLRRSVATDINAGLPGVDALLRYSNLGILGDVLAALASGHYGYLDWIALQSVPFTATDEYLEGWAGLKGVTRKAATPATGQVAFPAIGVAVVPIGTPVNRTDGRAYVTMAAAAAEAGIVVVRVQALLPGADGNADVATAMTLSGGVAGVTNAGAVATAIAGGADIEPDDALRGRMLAAYAAPPQGGSITDYPAWALAVPGVTRCWVRPGAMGPGTIALLFMMDDAQSAHAGFPQGSNGCSTWESRDTPAIGDQLAVADALFPKQSASALLYAVAPIANTIGLTIAGLATASATTKASIAAAVARALLLGGVPGGVTNLSSIEAAIAAVADTGGFVITAMTASTGAIGNGAVGNIVSNAGALPVLGGIGYA